MGFYVVVYPEPGDEAQVSEVEPGAPTLVMEVGNSALVVRVNVGRLGAYEVAAQFGRQLAAAATQFADRCENMIDPALPNLVPTGRNASERDEGRHG
ncbi:hypothetical protein [Streptoalloteichus hindustanus]|uniref:Uncharacterized protein n=1 Tax=Streptoalloteichus hindustanus TaxID=2017 RepID=A0A1M5QGY9_STRHI|nr:hypothetical protein [Streptoalloteichus hindustanus]SHH13178.1 hypothetical protein SAMN05444320_1263 [Streptoalloteichus hindustanus]